MENAPSNSGKSMEKHIEDSDINPERTRRKHREISNEPSRKRTKGEDSSTLEDIEKHYGKTMEEAYVSLNGKLIPCLKCLTLFYFILFLHFFVILIFYLYIL